MEDAGEDLAGEGNGDSASATGVESVTTVRDRESGRAAVLSFHSAAVPTLAPVPQELRSGSMRRAAQLVRHIRS